MRKDIGANTNAEPGDITSARIGITAKCVTCPITTTFGMTDLTITIGTPDVTATTMIVADQGTVTAERTAWHYGEPTGSPRGQPTKSTGRTTSWHDHKLPETGSTLDSD